MARGTPVSSTCFVTGKSSIRYARSSPRSTSRSLCRAMSTSLFPSIREIWAAIAPTTKVSDLASRSNVPAGVCSSQIAPDRLHRAFERRGVGTDGAAAPLARRDLP